MLCERENMEFLPKISFKFIFNGNYTLSNHIFTEYNNYWCLPNSVLACELSPVQGQ